MRDLLLWLRSIRGYVFDLWEHSPRYANCVPAVRAEEHLLEAFLLRRDDDSVELRPFGY